MRKMQQTTEHEKSQNHHSIIVFGSSGSPIVIWEIWIPAKKSVNFDSALKFDKPSSIQFLPIKIGIKSQVFFVV